MACAWVWFLCWTTWNITASTDMVISNDSSSSSCIKEVLFHPLLQAKQQLRRPRFKKHQKSTGHLASQTCIVLIFPLCSAFLAILQITSMPYAIQHLSLVLLMRNFLSIPLLNFLSPCLFARLTTMKMGDFSSHPFCCAIPWTICLVVLECHGLWGQGLSLLFVLGKQLLCYGYHFKQVTVIVINSKNNNKNNNNCTCFFTIHQIVSRAFHANIKKENWKIKEERSIDPSSVKCLIWGAIKENRND